MAKRSLKIQSLAAFQDEQIDTYGDGILEQK
jgi:hypothetical protein